LNWRRGNLVFALIGPKDSDQLLEVMAATSELLAIPPAAPGIVTSDSGPAVAVQSVDGGIGHADGAAESGQGGGGSLPLTPAIAVEDVTNPL
jgi:hypothetical protein